MTFYGLSEIYLYFWFLFYSLLFSFLIVLFLFWNYTLTLHWINRWCQFFKYIFAHSTGLNDHLYIMQHYTTPTYSSHRMHIKVPHFLLTVSWRGCYSRRITWNSVSMVPKTNSTHSFSHTSTLKTTTRFVRWQCYANQTRHRSFQQWKKSCNQCSIKRYGRRSQNERWQIITTA